MNLLANIRALLYQLDYLKIRIIQNGRGNANCEHQKLMQIESLDSIHAMDKERDE